MVVIDFSECLIDIMCRVFETAEQPELSGAVYRVRSSGWLGGRPAPAQGRR